MRTLAVLLLVMIGGAASAQVKNPFATMKYDSVMIYDYQPREEEEIVDSKGRLHPDIKKRLRLDEKTIHGLNTKLGDKTSYSGIIAACFDPHLGFVYYRQGKPVGHISVCLACNQLYSTPDIPLRRTLTGMSKPFRKYINFLLIKYKFSHQIQSGSFADRL